MSFIKLSNFQSIKLWKSHLVKYSIVFVLFISPNCRAQENAYFQFDYIEKYFKKIDTCEADLYSSVLNEIVSDEYKISYNDQIYNCLDVFILRYLSLSPTINNAKTSAHNKRFKFLNYVINESSLFHESPNVKGLVYFLKEQGDEFEDLFHREESLNFLISLKLSQRIRKYDFSENRVLLKKEIQSFINEYSSIPSEKYNPRITLPLNQLVLVWSRNQSDKPKDFLKTFEKDLKFIRSERFHIERFQSFLASPYSKSHIYLKDFRVLFDVLWL